MITGISRRSGHDHADLEGLRAAGLVRRASERTDTGIEHSLPVGAALRPLFAGGVLRRGTTVAISTSMDLGIQGSLQRSSDTTIDGGTSLLFAALAEAVAAGSWCAVVGLPNLGLVAAAEAGIPVERLALVPHPGPEWTSVVGAFLDGVDLVVTATPTGVPAGLASRLVARARQRGSVLIPVGRWPGADLTLEVVGGTWHGLDRGRGRLRRREVEVVASGRGAYARPRRARIWLPGPLGAATEAQTPVVPIERDLKVAS